MTETQTTNESAPAEKRMDVEIREAGYAQVTLYGSCDADVTVEDVKERFYHPYFGGRDAWVKDGRFGVVCHTD